MFRIVGFDPGLRRHAHALAPQAMCCVAPLVTSAGLLAWGALGDIPVAAICIAIARRLLRLRDHELVPEVEETLHVAPATPHFCLGWVERHG